MIMITRSSTIPSARYMTMSTQKSRRPCGHCLLTTIAICLSLSFLGPSTPYFFANAFSPSSPLAINIAETHFSCTRPPVVMSSKLYAESSSFENDGAPLPSPSDMRLREIQDELKQRWVSSLLLFIIICWTYILFYHLAILICISHIIYALSLFVLATVCPAEIYHMPIVLIVRVW